MWKIMKKSMMLVAVVMLLLASEVQAIDVDFYSDATIEDGDVYTNVFVYDTPPDTTTVDMFGGTVRVFHTYYSATVNIHGGELTTQVGMWEASTMNIYGGSVMLDSCLFTDSSTLNIYGGDVRMGSPYAEDSSTINIYGYDFSEFPAFSLTGFLSEGSPFEFIELTYAQSHINLIVIPEPTTLFLLVIGCFLLRKRI